MLFCKRYPRVAWSREVKPAALAQAKIAGIQLPNNRGVVLFTRLRCKQWDCEYCALKKQSIWRAFLYDKMPKVSDDWWFITITAHSRMRSQDASYKNLQRGIDVLMKRVRRVFGKVDYVRVFEKHPSSDAIHAHLVCSNLTPYVISGCHKNLQPGWLALTARDSSTGAWAIRSWLKKTAQECQIGYQADVQRLTNNYAVNYATKYLTKSAQEIDIKGIRHVQTTRGIGSPKGESDRIWQVGDYVTVKDFKAGERLLDVQTGEVLDADYWAEFDVYPPENT